MFIWNGFPMIPGLQELVISLEQGSSEIDGQLLSVLSSRPWRLPWEDTWLDFLLFICIRAGGHCNCICFISYTIYRKIIKQQERTEVRICEDDTERFRLAVGIRKNQKGLLQGLTQRYEARLLFSQWLSFLEPIFFKRFLLQNRSSIISIKTTLWLHSRHYTLSLGSVRVIIKEAVFDTIKTSIWGNSLVVQWLIFQAPNAGGLGSIPSQETRSHMSQQRSKILHAATKTQLCCCCPAARLCPTLCDPMDCCPPGSSVQGIFLARIQEQVAISFSRGSSWLRDQTHVFCIGRRILYLWATWEAHMTWTNHKSSGKYSLSACPWMTEKQIWVSPGWPLLTAS